MSVPETFLHRDVLPFGYTMEEIRDHIRWEQNYISMYGRTIAEPRLTALYGDHPYTYSRSKRMPHPWTEKLLQLKTIVEQKVGYNEEFNSCLLNYYRDGNDSIGLHADDEKELGEVPTIATLSLGDSRTLYLKSVLLEEKFELHHGDIFVMFGDTQKHWKHEIRKEKNKTARISLTFRYIH